ncbi:ABC transporter ATP-binding protein [Halosimplex salinum]|uniref:ABC transporter ATP-binding protein n=1 Tax=Halosimplex salinum TaxID=1710538 RepID=UPI0019D1A4EF|nr:ABC transporter ATP-binding protein [Halosimplex salinum]
MTATLVAEDVRRAYGETVALDGVSLSVDAGEVFALVGPNGAGKTTLVRALTGTTDADGSVSVFGADPRTVDRERIGLLPQAFDPPARLTARELLTYYAGLYDEARDVDAVLADVGLSDDADTWYEDLSGGQQRRTCVGSALVNDPDLLFLDEPTTGIDPAGRRSLWDLLEDLAAGGTTIVLTTHDMAEAHRLADRVGLLADGRLVAVDDPDALVAEFGGESRLIVETDADPDALDLEYPAERAGDSLVVSDVPPEAIGDVVDALAAAGASYDALTWSEPDLEDVYLELAGTDGTRYDREGAGRGRERAATAASTEDAGPAEGDR